MLQILPLLSSIILFEVRLEHCAGSVRFPFRSLIRYPGESTQSYCDYSQIVSATDSFQVQGLCSLHSDLKIRPVAIIPAGVSAGNWFRIA